MTEQETALLGQQLARGWIENLWLTDVASTWCHLTGRSFDEFWRAPQIGRVHVCPVRAHVHDQWPKLSAWLWARRVRDMRNAAFEDRLARLILERTASNSTQKRAAKGIHTARFYTKKAMIAAGVGISVSAKAAGWRHDWKTVK